MTSFFDQVYRYRDT